MIAPTMVCIALVSMTTFNNKGAFSTLVHANHYNRHSAVLRAATELFVNNDAPSREDLLHFEELCLRFLPKLDLQAKAEISERLADCAFLPRAVAVTLSREDISVAAPLLCRHYGFSDDDLLVILANGNQLHALAISSRERLSDKVTVALSRFKLPGFESHGDKSNQPGRTMRRDEPREKANLMSSDSASSLLDKHTGYDAGHAPDAEMSGVLAIASLEGFLRCEPAHVLTGLHAFEGTLKSNASSDPLLLLKTAYGRAERAVEFVKLARSRDALAFELLLAAECDLSEPQTRDILTDSRGFALAICLKALALPDIAAREAFLLLNPAIGRDIDQVYLLDWFYGAISPASARGLLERWRQAGETAGTRRTGTYQPIHQGETLPDARQTRTTLKEMRAEAERARANSAAG